MQRGPGFHCYVLKKLLFFLKFMLNLFRIPPLMVLLRCKFFRASFLHLIKDTDSMYEHAAQIFGSENIVNAFKEWYMIQSVYRFNQNEI